MARAVEVEVSGTVTGVSFRAYAAKEATRLELGGWIRNEGEDLVVVVLEGDDDAVEEMVGWLHGGSPSASVDQVHVTESEVSGYDSFEVRYY